MYKIFDQKKKLNHIKTKCELRETKYKKKATKTDLRVGFYLTFFFVSNNKFF